MLPRASENDGSILVSDHVREAPDIVVLPRRSKEKARCWQRRRQVPSCATRCSGLSVDHLGRLVLHANNPCPIFAYKFDIFSFELRFCQPRPVMSSCPNIWQRLRLNETTPSCPSSCAPSVITSHRAVGHQLAAATSMARDSSQYLRLRPL